MNKICYEKNDVGKVFALTVGVALAASLVLSAIFTKSATDSLQFWLTQAFYTLAIGSVAPLYALITKTNFVSATKLKSKPPLTHVLWGVLTAAFLIMLMLPLNELILDGIEALGLKRPTVSLENHMDVVPMVIVSCFVASFCEELTFRGTLASGLSQSKNGVGAVLASGALFALFHMNPAQTLHQFALGSLMTLFFFRSDSLWTSIAIHLFNNLAAVVMTFTLPANFAETNRIWLIIVGAIGVALSLTLYLKLTSSRRKTAEQPKPELFSIVALSTAICLCLAVWITSLLG